MFAGDSIGLEKLSPKARTSKTSEEGSHVQRLRR